MRKYLKKLVCGVLLTGLLSVAAFPYANAASTTFRVVRQPADAAVYTGETVQLSVAASGGDKLSYQWFMNSKDNTATGNRLPGANAATYTPTTAKVGTLYYYCKVFSYGTLIATICSDAAAVVVKAPPVIKKQPVGLSVYSGETAELSVQASGSGTLTYQWYSNTANSQTNAVLIYNAIGPTYSAPTATAGTTYYFCVVTIKDTAVTSTPVFAIASSIVKVVVNPVSTTVPTITSQPSSSTVFTGTPVQLSVSAVAAGTLSYQWYRSDVIGTADGTAIEGATTPRYSVPTGTEGSGYYYCVVTNTPASGTETYKTASGIAAVAVRLPAAITRQPIGADARPGDTVTLSVEAVGSGTLSYQWYKNAADSVTAGTAIDGATAASYTVPTSSTGTAYYFCVVSNTDDTVTETVKTRSAVSSTARVAILAETGSAPSITTQPAPVTVFSGTSVTLSVTAEGTGALSYQWYEGTSAGTPVTGAVSASYKVPDHSDGTYYYYCVVTNTADTVSGPQAMTSASASAAVVILPAPLITGQPADARICSGGTATLSVGASGSGNLTYQWYCTKNSETAGLKISGATGPAYEAKGVSVGTLYYYCVVTDTDSSVTLGSKSSSVTSAYAKVTVVSDIANPPEITKQPASVAVVVGDTAKLSVTATGSGTLTYQWYTNTRQTTRGATPIVGATGDTYAPPADAAGKAYYYCQVTNTDLTRTTTPVKSVLTSIVLVTVHTKDPVIARQPAAARLYTGTSHTLSVTATGFGTLTYQWYCGATDDMSAGTAIAGAVSSKLQVPSDTPGTLYYYCVVTNTVPTAAGPVSGTAASAAARVEIVPYPAITAQPTGLTVSSGDSYTLSVTANGSGALKYQWYHTGTAGAVGMPIRNATKASYTVTTAPASASKTIYYYCIVTVSDRTMTVKPVANLKSEVAAVTIKAVNAAPPTITVKPAGQTLKVGDGAYLTVTATGSGTLTYQWYSNTKNSTSKATPIAGATNSILVIPTAKAGTTYYFCVITNTDNTMPGIKTAAVTSTIARITIKSS
jgi:hypothetical protein